MSKTLRELFPGNLGRLTLSTLVLRMKKPELLDLDMDQPLPEAMTAELEQELRKLQEGNRERS